MRLENTTQVLVVGAGPVGMTAALLLARRGVQATVIDEDSGPAARSYACALHPYTLELFDNLGLLDAILPLGRRLDAVAFYDGSTRSAAVEFPQIPAKYPFALVLPQNALEGLLENALKREADVRIHWNHRLMDLRTDNRGVVSTVDQLGGSAVGYIVPHWETVVKKTREIRAELLIGADGHSSIVRRRLEIGREQMGEPERFAVFEFETDADLPNEVRVVFDDTTTNVLWPLPGNRYRWSFQLAGEDLQEAFPDKERRAYWIEDPARDQRIEARLRRFIETRAPWFKANIRQFDWICRVRFEHSFATRFVEDRSYLIGDAAHQTGPAGVQSLNVGLCEAEELSEILDARLQQPSAAEGTKRWEDRWRTEWACLLGGKGSPTGSDKTDPWVQKHAARILPCLPASGENLAQCLKQLGLKSQ